jgi:hypothetical protein
MEVAVKNDEALIKMASIVQKAMSLNKTSEGGGELLSERDKELLFAEIKNIEVPALPQKIVA